MPATWNRSRLVENSRLKSSGDMPYSSASTSNSIRSGASVKPSGSGMGEALLRFVGHGLRADTVTHTTAAKVLGVRPGAVEPLLSSVMGLGNGAPKRKAT
jgi:hypothetical protein